MRKENITVIGLGYVGLPLLIELSKKFVVKGFDINKKKILQLKEGSEPDLILNKTELKKLKKLELTHNPKDIQQSNVYIICVPTPISKHKLPDLSLLKNASKIVGKVISDKDLVILESTVFPGATEEVCVPLIEKYSKLTPTKLQFFFFTRKESLLRSMATVVNPPLLSHKTSRSTFQRAVESTAEM